MNRESAFGDPVEVLARLRADFDRSFQEASVPAPLLEDFLLLRVGGEAFAVRMGEVGGIYADREVTALPGSPPYLTGVAGLRGSVFPVYDLGVLLGYPVPKAPRRWFLLVRRREPLGVAFDRFERHLQVGDGRTAPSDGGGDRRHVRAILLVGEERIPIVSLPAVAEDADRMGARDVETQQDDERA